MSRKQKPKPKTDPFFMFYIVWPIQNLWDSAVSYYRRLTGMWWCEHCNVWHGRRVRKFYWYSWVSLTRTSHTVCSLWKDEDTNNDQAN